MRKMVSLLSVVLILGAVDLASALSPGATPVVRNGDANADGNVDSVDAIHLLGFLYNGGPAPTPLSCGGPVLLQNGDVDGNGIVCLTDVVFLLTWIHQGGPAPIDRCAMLQS
jgi:hypothetical protein